MKKTALLFIVALLLSSCTPYLVNTQEYEILNEDLGTAWKHVSSYKYLEIYSLVSPREFEANGGGDCKGFSTDLMYYLGRDSSIAFITFPEGGKHAIILYHGRYIEPQEYNDYLDPSIFTLDYTISYDKWMMGVTEYGTKNIFNNVRK